jgi:hypothetical protein
VAPKGAPTYARGAAVRSFVDGLVAQHAGYDDLLRAAERFEAIGEPVIHGQALHAAARVAPSIADGNALLPPASATSPPTSTDALLLPC